MAKTGKQILHKREIKIERLSEEEGEKGVKGTGKWLTNIKVLKKSCTKA